jgi:hypothetical protein
LLWQKVFLKPRHNLKAWKSYNASGHNKDGFSCYAHLTQCRYSNTASVKDTQNPKQQVEIWDEIWKNIGKEILRGMQEVQELEGLELRLDLKGSPFVSTGKAPQHAISYAVGKSLADVNRNQRMDSRTDKSGRPKYELIGKVHWFSHSITDYLSANPNDVLLWHKAGLLSVGCRLLNETEVAFIGGIASHHHIDSIPIVQPRFDIDYDPAYHGTLMGLTPEQYHYFSSSYLKAQRPSRHGLEVFEKPYHERLKFIFDLDEKQFTRYKQLITLVHSYQQRKQKRVDLQELEPYRDLLLKEINIKYADRNNHNSFYGKKGIDKYWYKPEKTVSIARLSNFINKNLRDRSPYRKLKNEIRAHLINFYAEQIFRKANAQARASGKIPIYRAPDGKFKRLPKTADLLKKSLVQDAKRDNKDKKRKAEDTGIADKISQVGFLKRLRQQTYQGVIPVNPRRELLFHINTVLGDGNCAVTSLPVRDRQELCDHLTRAIEVNDNRQMLIDELVEALTMRDSFLSPEQAVVWQGWEQAQIDYDLAAQAFAERLAQYKLMLLNQGLITRDSSDKVIINFIKNSIAFNDHFIQLKNLHQQKQKCKGRIENIDERKREFLASMEVCKSYIDNLVAKAGHWVGKGCIHLLAKMKGISMCVWVEQEHKAQLQYDSTYSVLAHDANSPDAQIHHMVFMQGSNHYNLPEVIRDSYQLEADLGVVLR